MGRKRGVQYRMGSFYRQDDRTGFTTRADRTKKEWTGLIVDERVWEPRQPQDFVKGVKDDQSVPEARPLGALVFVGPITVMTTANAAVGATVLQVNSVAGFSNGDKVGVMLDTGSFFHTTLNGAPGGSSITLASGLPASAASGNIVTDFSASKV